MFSALAVASVAGLAFSAASSAMLIDLNSTPFAAKSILKSTNFDYIVVGGGTAGLTVARRLSERPNINVLVLEAGRSGVNDTLVTIPENSFHFLFTDIDWGYSTAPQTHAVGQHINLSSGKILGGDSAVNGLVWCRGPRAEYDAIEQLGNPNWNWDSFYNAMQTAEALEPPSQQLTDEFGFVIQPNSLGSQGPVAVGFPAFLPLQHQKFVNASIELGHRFNGDAYGGDNTGVFYTLSSEKHSSVRVTSEFAYLDPVLSRKNLIVMSHALVTNVTSAPRPSTSSLYKASGVSVRFPDGSIAQANVNVSHGEVILSAGTIRTPQILELSGIGDPNVLTPLGIPVKVNLSGVGANYEDHTLTILTYELKEPYLSFDALGYNATLKAEQETLYTEGQGWFTFAQGVLNMEPANIVLTESEMATAQTLLQDKPPTISQDQFDIIKFQVLNGIPQAEYLLFNSFSGGTSKEPNRSYVSMAVTHLHPLSRGSIHINSASIDDYPTINPNVLESDWDRWFLAKATAYARKFFQTESFQEIFESTEVFPGPDVSTDQQWTDFITSNINIGYHSVGTASLLPRDKNGVVGPDLKVYGTDNLRVADLSILPLLISAHTQPAAYAVGERAAAIILS